MNETPGQALDRLEEGLNKEVLIKYQVQFCPWDSPDVWKIRTVWQYHMEYKYAGLTLSEAVDKCLDNHAYKGERNACKR